MRNPALVQVGGPLAPFAEGFRARLELLGYARQPRVVHLELMDQLSHWLDERGLDGSALSTEAMEEFVLDRQAAGLRTGAPWRDVPPLRPVGPGLCLFRRWQRNGTWARIVTQLQAEVDAKGLIAWDVNVDSTVCRAHQHAAGAAKRGDLQKEPPGGVFVEPADHGLGRSRGGPTTKYDNLAVRCEATVLVTAINEWLRPALSQPASGVPPTTIRSCATWSTLPPMTGTTGARSSSAPAASPLTVWRTNWALSVCLSNLNYDLKEGRMTAAELENGGMCVPVLNAARPSISPSIRP